MTQFFNPVFFLNSIAVFGIISSTLIPTCKKVGSDLGLGGGFRWELPFPLPQATGLS